MPHARSAIAVGLTLGVLTAASLLATTTPPVGKPGSPAAAEQAFIQRRESRLSLLATPPTVPQAAPGSPAFANPIDVFLAQAPTRDPAAATPPLCDDASFVRRVYLDLIGVIPTVRECREFLADTGDQKRERLIERLLARDADYADHWTPFWEDALVSSRAGTTGGMASHGDYSGWINDAFRTNRPFDLFAAELLDPSLPRHKKAEMGSDNGAPRRVHIVLNDSHKDTLQSAAGIAQVFMGTAMKCAGCHNHFENKEWPQRRFTAFAGYFARQDLELIRCERETGEIVKAAFPFAIPGTENDPALAAAGTDLDARLHVAATLMTDPLNPRFAKAVVNRLWKRYLGLGLFEPVDDYRESVPISHPELLAWLSDDFMRHAFDIKHTVRLILTSRAYQARYDPVRADHFDGDAPGAPRLFESPQLRRLTAEQFSDSIGVSMKQVLDPKSRLFRSENSTGLARVLGRPATRNDVSTGRSDDTAVLTGLELLNGEEFQSLTRKGPLFEQLTAEHDPAGAAKLAFMAVLSREPTPAELSLATDAVKQGPDGVQDLLWSLFTGPEFAYVR